MPYANPANKAEWQRNNRAMKASRPFVGVDGEGGSLNGEHVYTLFRIGTSYIYDEDGLSADQVLRFIMEYATTYPSHILVSFFFDYDVTMICKALPKATVDYLLDRSGGGLWHFTKYHDFEIDYIPSKRFAVKRGKKVVIIHDTGGFFQCSFLKALALWSIPTDEENAVIESGKGRRSSFTAKMSDEEIEYNRLECILLARLMEEFRLVTDELGLTLSSWQGAGNVATAILKKYRVPNIKQRTVPVDIENYARQAYYGGRFEVSKLGDIPHVYEYDLASAYPSVMNKLPCLVHTHWERFKGMPNPEASWYCARIDYESTGNYGPFPCRKKDGAIYFPLSGKGWYWSPEIVEAQEALGTKIDFVGGIQGYRQCDCPSYTWIPAMYDERLRIGKSGKGIVLKLGLNSLYGKFAQSVGQPRFASPILAGLITSYTRAKLLSIFRYHDSDKVVMFATDAAYLTEKAKFPVTRSKKLGMFEDSKPKDLFVCKPGFHFTRGEALVKSRGISSNYLDGLEDRFRSAWEKDRYDGFVEIRNISTFIGLRLSRQLADLRETPREYGFEFDNYDAGRWVNRKVRMSFNPSSKRCIDGNGELVPYEHSAMTIPYNRLMGVDPLIFTHPDSNNLYNGILED